MKKRSEFEQKLADILDSERKVTPSQLALLSGLAEEEAALFECEWARTVRERKLYILSRLVKLRGDSLFFDFSRVFHACLDDGDAEVRRAAIKTIEGEEEDGAVVTTLIRLLREDEEEKVQIEAAVALGQFALLAAVKKLSHLQEKEIYSNLLAVIEDESATEEVKRRCLEAIAPLDSPRIKRLIERAYHHSNVEIKASAVCAMGRNCDPVWLPLISAEKDNKAPVVRCKVAEACGELGREEAVPFLIDLAWDGDAQVREASMRALVLIGGARAEGALRQLRGSSYQDVSQTAKEALSELEKSTGFFDI
ncbi:MAG: HEAT repeat domain-containing protein [Dehalococcoidia bacterium]|nr:HEAT repeat domain-containing protein [Dehalococcoidia bacterium]